MDHIVLEIGIALFLVVIAALIAGKFKLSIAPFLILVGMAVGPHAPTIGIFDFTFIESNEFIAFMGRIGVLFLLFYLGLEFSVGRLIKSGRAITIGGTFYVLINFAMGFLFGYFAGFPMKEILVIIGITTFSSSAIVAKVLVDFKRTANPETEMILGITMFEDVALAVYLSVISGLILSDSSSLADILTTMLIVLGYILLFLFVARKATPFLNKVLNISSNETFILVVFSVLFFVAGFSETLHVAEAIGALLLGLALSETDHRERIEKMVIPFRDFFGAIFFFSFGLTIDPYSLGGAVGYAVIAAILTIGGCITAGMLAGRSAKLSPKVSTNIGLTLMSRGEFSVIVANLALAGGLSAIIQPFAALYVLLLAILGPLMTKESFKVYKVLNVFFKWDKKKPKLEKEA